jgi:hypothetical protein
MILRREMSTVATTRVKERVASRGGGEGVTSCGEGEEGVRSWVEEEREEWERGLIQIIVHWIWEINGESYLAIYTVDFDDVLILDVTFLVDLV